MLLFSKMSIQALKPTQHPTQLIPEVKRPGHKADQSPPSSAVIKNEWSYVHTSPYAFKNCTGETLLYFAYYINRIHTYILKLTLNSNSST